MKKKASSTANIGTFAQQVASAAADGYVMLPRQYNGAVSERKSGAPTHEEYLNATLAMVSGTGEVVGKGAGKMLAPSVMGREEVVKGAGTEGLGYITWGLGNRLPNVISWLTNILPYTATATKFNVDVAAGMGFVPKYRYSIVSQGSIVTKEIDYDTAGLILEEQLIEARKELMKFYAENGDKGTSEPSSALIGEDLTKTSVEGSDLYKELEKSYKKKIERIEQDLKDWTETKEKVKDFIGRNNLPLLSLHLFNDMVLFGICFPELELSKLQTVQPKNAMWEPQITGITYREAHACRLEKMDAQGVINYVYHSNRWLDYSAKVGESKDIIAIPALDPEHPAKSLEEKVRDYKTKNPQGDPASRPTRFICPSFYPTAGKPYYPQPSWHSIFGGEVYSFLSTIVADRARRRKNKNILGYIIYVHQDYIRQLQTQRQMELAASDPTRKPGQALTQKEKQQMLDEVWESINKFIASRDNAGKPLLAFTFTDSQGKDHDAYRIVEVPNATAKDAQAQKTELEEISAIVFFALQCHPELIGAVPGRSGAGGGTYQRELYLLKQLQIAPTQQIILRVLDSITAFNKWDSHLRWVVRQQVLTTLDNSKSGLTETQTN